MTRTAALVVAALAVMQGGVAAQTRTAPAARTAAKKPTIEPAMVKCPNVLGTGVKTQREFCDVLTGRDPADGIVIDLPPHAGPVTLTFDLHNRHMYSEELIRANRAYRRYTATIGLLTADNTLISRAIVLNNALSVSPSAKRLMPASRNLIARPARLPCRSRRWKWPKKRKLLLSSVQPTRALRSAISLARLSRPAKATRNNQSILL